MKSSDLRKDDPLYYKLKIEEVLKQAHKKGVKMEIETMYVRPERVRMQFIGQNGDRVGLELI